MTKRKIIQLNRKWHRYLGLILGIQFFLWTIGGLYFSWTNIDEIRGDTLKKENTHILKNGSYVSPNILLSQIDSKDSIINIELNTILKKEVYKVITKQGDIKKVRLFNANTGNPIPSLNKEQSIKVAKEKLAIVAPIQKVEYLTTTGKHHEYRGRPLPAYAFTFDAPANTTIYVSTEHANVQTFRSNKWRIFDFLWMLHTMDYQERDNFNNILLRAFSLFGLVTILSGFSLYIFTSKSILKKRKQ